jgi:hypothetical protein
VVAEAIEYTSKPAIGGIKEEKTLAINPLRSPDSPKP